MMNYFQNHTVHVTDTGFQPKVITVHPRDRIWWVWQGGKKPHNITQVRICLCTQGGVGVRPITIL